MGLKDNRYYNGVPTRRTTRCCSAVALAALLFVFAAARSAARGDAGPQPFWPVRTLWTLALNTEVTQRPAFDEARAYFPIEGKRLAAYDITSGKQLWIVDARPLYAPVAGSGFVFFVEDEALVAIKAEDGSRAWTSPVDGALAVAPVWTDGWLLLATKSGTIVAVRASDGHEIWRHDVGVGVHDEPAVSGTRIFLPLDNGRVIALQIETGSPLWERRLGGAPGAILALDERLFVGATDNFFYALKTDTGEVDWRWRTGAVAVGLPAVDKDRVYFAALDNTARALNRSNGVQQWIQLLKLRPMAGALRVGASVIVYGLVPPMRAMNTSDGKGGGDVSVPGQLIAVAPPQALGADEALPLLIVTTRDVASGDTVTLLTRSVEPAASPLAALPNPLNAIPTLANSTGL